MTFGAKMKPDGGAVQAANRRAGWLRFAARLLVSAALLVWVVSQAGIGAVLLRFGQTDGSWAAFALLLLVIQYAIMVLRWDLVLRRAFGLHLPLRQLCLVFGLGELMGTYLPRFVGLNAIRALPLAKVAPIATVLRAVLVDRTFGLAALLLLIAMSLPLRGAAPQFTTAAVTLGLVSIGGLLGLAAVISRPERWRALPILGRRIGPVARDLRGTVTDLPIAGAVLATGLAKHLLSVLLIWAIGRMLGAELGLLSCLMIVPAALLVSALPISVGGWGLREAAIVTGFSLIGVDAEAAATASIAFGLSVLVVSAVGVALPWLPERGRRRD